MASKKMTYIPGIIIAAIGVAVDASGFKGFDRSETHMPESNYSANDVRADENRVNEMAMILNRLDGSKEPTRDFISGGLEAAGALGKIVKGQELSTSPDSLPYNPGETNPPKVREFQEKMSELLSKMPDVSVKELAYEDGTNR